MKNGAELKKITDNIKSLTIKIMEEKKKLLGSVAISPKIIEEVERQ